MKEETAIDSDFPKKLKQLRQDRGLSQGQLAKKIGADLQRVSKYERGVNCPTAEMVVRIANVFDVSLDYLLRGKMEGTSRIKNASLLTLLENVNHFSEKDQETLVSILDAFVKRHQLESFATR